MTGHMEDQCAYFCSNILKECSELCRAHRLCGRKPLLANNDVALVPNALAHGLQPNLLRHPARKQISPILLQFLYAISDYVNCTKY